MIRFGIDSFWYPCLGDATHLLLSVSVCTLGQKLRFNSHSLVDGLFPCLIWDSGSHWLIALSMHHRFWYWCLGDSTHLLLGVSVCTLGQKVGLYSNSLVGYLFGCWPNSAFVYTLILNRPHGMNVLVMQLTCPFVYQIAYCIAAKKLGLVVTISFL